MRVLAPDAETGEAYRELFPEAVQRIAASARLLEDKGFRRYAESAVLKEVADFIDTVPR